MKKITLTLNDDLAAEARRHAASRRISLSQLVREVLKRHVREASEYDLAMHQFLSQMPVTLKRASDSYPSRARTHQRSGRR